MSPRTGTGRDFYVTVSLVLAILALIFDYLDGQAWNLSRLAPGLAYAVPAVLIAELIADLHRTQYKRVYFKRNAIPVAFIGLFLLLFTVHTVFPYSSLGLGLGNLAMVVVIMRNTLILLRVFEWIRGLSSFMQTLSAHPARTILLSFFLVIVAGTLLLMLPFTAAEGAGLGFVDALFTATSAVCVTGLIVVDTATAFSVYGRLIILGLIQIGGLGMMILSYFTVFVVRRTVSVEDKMLISYILSERDMTRLARTLKSIIYATFGIEAVGAILLFFAMGRAVGGSFAQRLLFAVFHSVSAFSNAGFALFSDSLEVFRSSVPVVSIVSLLIIVGGIGFSVLLNFGGIITDRVRNLLRRRRGRARRLSVNTQVVCVATLVLLVAGMILVYGLEHRNTLAPYGLGTQYLSAFFQSVTLRTAGFNTIPVGALTVPTYLVMVVFMFIGGASGSTAGGIKVNTFIVLGAYLRSVLQDKDTVILYKHSVPMRTVLRAFMIMMFAVSSVVLGTVVLSVLEQAPLEHLVFEVVSAFGTVGLSSGITSTLSQPGKIVISLLMFIGRLGPLTVLAAAAMTEKKIRIEYPRGRILVG